MSHAPCLAKLLHKGDFPEAPRDAEEEERKLRLKMLRTQQGIWHGKKRGIVVFEGFDASGKGGAIRRLVESIDPRGFHVHPIGPPLPDEQGKHYLYRFWARLPAPGTIAIFDRSWYGRVLVERVDELTPKARWKAGYKEIREFERMLLDDGVDLVKIFLAIDKREQLKRFEDRLKDPYKQWKLTDSDVEARKKWRQYVRAADDAFEETHSERAPWYLIPANDKRFARLEVLRVVTKQLGSHRQWMEDKALKMQTRGIKAALKELGRKGL